MDIYLSLSINFVVETKLPLDKKLPLNKKLSLDKKVGEKNKKLVSRKHVIQLMFT